MSGDTTKDALDHLCATDPLWIKALQLVQLAGRQGTDAAVPAAQLVCALVLLASESNDSQEFLAFCADSLISTPLQSARK